MQNMAVDSLIKNIETKIVIKFQFINFMTYLTRVANSMVIFSASCGKFSPPSSPSVPPLPQLRGPNSNPQTQIPVLWPKPIQKAQILA